MHNDTIASIIDRDARMCHLSKGDTCINYIRGYVKYTVYYRNTDLEDVDMIEINRDGKPSRSTKPTKYATHRW